MDIFDEIYDYNNDGKLDFFEASCRDADLISDLQNAQKHQSKQKPGKYKTEDFPEKNDPPVTSERNESPLWMQTLISFLSVFLIIGAFIIILFCDLSTGGTVLVLCGAVAISLLLLNAGNLIS